MLIDEGADGFDSFGKAIDLEKEHDRADGNFITRLKHGFLNAGTVAEGAVTGTHITQHDLAAVNAELTMLSGDSGERDAQITSIPSPYDNAIFA